MTGSQATISSKKDRHEGLVGALLPALEQSGHALREQRRIVARQPHADGKRDRAHFAEENPRGRPVDGAGRHQQQRRHDGEQNGGLTEKAGEHGEVRPRAH
jgi:hypothetical protein